MNYLLDTNACIAIINKRPLSVRERLQDELDARAEVFTSSIVIFELWYAVAKSVRQDANARRLESFLAGPVRLLNFEEEDSRYAGRIRAYAEAAGKPIGAYDVMIAGQALRNKMTLVTANVREFRRVAGLNWEDWAGG